MLMGSDQSHTNTHFSFITATSLLQFRLNQCLLLHLRLFSVLSSAYRKPQLHSSLMSTHLKMPSRASLPQQRRAAPPKRSSLLIPSSRLLLHPRLTQRHPSSRTRPIRHVRGRLHTYVATPLASCSVRNWKINNQYLNTVQATPALHSTRGAEFLLQLLLFPSLLTK